LLSDGLRPFNIDRRCLTCQHSALNIDTCLDEFHRPIGSYRVRVSLREDHSTNAGLNQCLNARTRAAGMPTRLERDDGGRTASCLPSHLQRNDFRVWRSGTSMGTFTNCVPRLVDQNTTDAGVWTTPVDWIDRQRKGASHCVTLLGCGH
jgi:hypothetical protein